GRAIAAASRLPQSPSIEGRRRDLCREWSWRCALPVDPGHPARSIAGVEEPCGVLGPELGRQALRDAPTPEIDEIAVKIVETGVERHDFDPDRQCALDQGR